MNIAQSLIILIIAPLLVALQWAIIIAIIFSWLVGFGVLDTRNQMVYRLHYIFDTFLNAIVGPFRRWIPPIGGLDFTPIIVLFGLSWLKWFLIAYVVPALG